MASTLSPSVAYATTPNAHSHSHAYHTPSPASAARPPVASELDTTMEDSDEDAGHTQQPDDEFAFNAPTYYDLKHPEMEQQYVNNADGYFYAAEEAARLNAQNLQNSFNGHIEDHRPQSPAPPATPIRPPPSHNGRTPQTPFGHYREPQADNSEDSDAEMTDDNAHGHSGMAHDDDDDDMSDGGRSDGTLVLESLDTPTAPSSARSASTLPPPPPAPRSLGHSHSHGLSSSLLQPTQAYLNRLQAEQAARERPTQYADSVDGGGHKLTKARSPHLRTSQRQHSEPKMSSTSRELQKIQAEKTRVQLEALKVREYHERVRAQRVPTNVHQRSTKQLTIPQSPYLEVGHRSRRTNSLNQSMTSSEDGDASAVRDEPHPYIAPEQFLSRDFEYPATTHAAGRSHSQSHNHREVTVPHTPQLQTSARAAARRNVFPGVDASPEQPHRVDYSKMKVNGVTRPLSPQFETDRRAAAAAAHRKPIEIVDKDAEELNRKFHARPVPRRILEAPPLKKTSPQQAHAALTRPMSPKLATSARARLTASSASLEDESTHPEKKVFRRTGPVVAETPPLRSLQRHHAYQEQLRRRQEAEEEEMRRQREFKAQPIRLTTTPPKFEGSKKPLTEVQPFALRGDRIHERAQERLERLRRDEEERTRAATQFRAKPMPDLSASDDEASARSVAPPRAARVLTKPSSPKFATDRRAAERATYVAGERERRARDEEYKRQAEAEKRRLEEEEIKRLRREQLTFHARPVPVSKGFEVKPSSRNLTEPESPHLQTKARGGSATTAA